MKRCYDDDMNDEWMINTMIMNVDGILCSFTLHVDSQTHTQSE